MTTACGRRIRYATLVSRERPRRLTLLLDRYGLPVVYYRRLLRGKV
ncbi:hypothetical protein WDZ17_01045 [Pseudokineococcus basanitobsidens]|uniref:Uncharacterized protein n=1 Tax=Pseudokineococcus basanitobsidens TaxID=1926649 RepID=A0ABU8RFP3_9ACTN